MTFPLDQTHTGTDPLTKIHLHKPVTHLLTANQLCDVTSEASKLNWQDSEHIHLVGFLQKYSPHTLAPLRAKSAWYENPFFFGMFVFYRVFHWGPEGHNWCRNGLIEIKTQIASIATWTKSCFMFVAAWSKARKTDPDTVQTSKSETQASSTNPSFTSVSTDGATHSEQYFLSFHHFLLNGSGCVVKRLVTTMS